MAIYWLNPATATPPDKSTPWDGRVVLDPKPTTNRLSQEDRRVVLGFGWPIGQLLDRGIGSRVGWQWVAIMGRMEFRVCNDGLGAAVCGALPGRLSGGDLVAGTREPGGKYEEALPLLERSLAIREQELGANDPSTATSLNNLALLYQSMGRYEEALPLFQRAVEIATQTLGPDHPNTQLFKQNLQILRDSLNP
ncbi:tetratricopeptide repeat protein [Prochlorothrix hollandica]|uniref:tetratricopeptide repeat protein n=2 Tax=Prochlorothrix hollandica TaxID=1223 RepID=UPI0011D27D61|nr:tetratricopeptide repeat protein [Prochlorothrix hollandica]